MSGWQITKLAGLCPVCARDGERKVGCEWGDRVNDGLGSIDDDRSGRIIKMCVKVPPFKISPQGGSTLAVLPGCHSFGQPLTFQEFGPNRKDDWFRHFGLLLRVTFSQFR
jgi:hypothetical protein